MTTLSASLALAFLTLALAAPRVHGGEPPAPRSGYAAVDGLSLYYEIHGEGGVPLVLLHGGGSTIDSSFGKVIEGYARTRKVVAFDQQGHGRTADVDRPFRFEQSADDAAALLRHLGIEKADFLGYSNGGHIAIEVALRHPEMVRKLVLESANFNRDGCDPGFWESFKDAKIDAMPAELKEAYTRVAPRPGDLPVFFRKSVDRMLHFQGWTDEQMRSIQVPTLVLAGDRDILSPEHAVRAYRLLPHGQLAILPGVDHMTIVGRADLLTPIVLSFLDAPMPDGR